MAVLDGDSLILTYLETLDETSTPSVNDFTVSVNGSVRSMTNVAILNQTVLLTLSQPVFYNDVVAFTYTVPGTNTLRD